MKESIERQSFVLYYDWGYPIWHLSDEEAGQLFKGLMLYESQIETYRSKNEMPSPLKSSAAIATFNVFKPTLDKDYEKWIKTRDTKAANGSKGGRPRKNSADTDTQKKP